MKQIYTLLLMVLAVGVFAQPTLTSSWVVGPPVTFSTFTINSHGTGYHEGAGGPNQTWDFHTDTTQWQENNSYISSWSQQDSTYFPTATMGIHDYIVPASFYNDIFYQLTGNVFSYLGYYNPAINELSKTKQEVFHFPFTYLSTFTDAYSGSYSKNYAGTFQMSNFTEQDTVIADGYGTLITPFYTFSNVLRVKTLSTIQGRRCTGCFPPVYSYDTTRMVSYKWYSPSYPGVELMSISHAQGDSIQRDGRFAYNINTGIETITATDNWQLYPNPTNDKLQITSSDATGGSLVLIDMMGNVLSATTIDAGEKSKTIDMSALAQGMYIVSYQSGSGAGCKKVVKQ